MNTVNWQKKKIVESKFHQFEAFEKINDIIVKERRGKEITLVDNSTLIEFMSCSYLGLDQDKRVVEAAINNIKRSGVNFAVARTRMRMQSFVVLEDLLNQIFDGRCITFTSLHLTHLGMLPLIASGEMPSYPIKKNGSLFILHKTAHASIQIQRGLMQQFGEVIFDNFKHIQELEQKFKQAYLSKRTPIVCADGVGSMGGLSLIEELFNLAEQYEGYIYLDDAHGVSVYGKHGCGYVLNKLGKYHPRLMLAISLSKAFGTNGAAIVLPSKEDEKFVRQFASTYMFSNPLPLSIVDSAIAAAEIHLSDEIYVLQNRLQDHLKFFDLLVQQSLSKEKIINFQSSSPIRGIFVGNESQAIKIARQLRDNYRIGVTAAMYPVVPKDKSILRITLGADHRIDHIKQLQFALSQLITD